MSKHHHPAPAQLILHWILNLNLKVLKVKEKERILKAAKEKQLVTYRGVPIRMSADFSKETLQARRDQQEIF